MSKLSGIVLVASGILASLGAAAAQPSAQPSREEMEAAVRTTPMGPVCWAAIVEALSQVGTRCVEDEDPAFRAALDQANLDLGEMLKVKGGWSDEHLAGFRKQMGNHDAPANQLCAGDGLEFYEAMATGGPEMIALQTEAMLERSGPPEWGTCL